MPFKEITSTGTDVTVLEVPADKIYRIKGIYVYNAAGSNATVEIKDNYTYSLGSSSGSSGSRTLIKTVVGAGTKEDLTKLIGEEIIGTLAVNTDQQPIYVYVGVEEKGGE